MLQKLWKKSKDDIKDWRERQSHLSLMPVLPKGESSQGRALFKKQSKELDPGQTFFFVLPIIKPEIILLAWLNFVLNVSNTNLNKTEKGFTQLLLSHSHVPCYLSHTYPRYS